MLYIDKDALATAKNEYSDYSTRMTELKTKLVNAVDDIRNAWDSEAGDAFFNKFDEEWLKNFDDYANVIHHMAVNMQIAQNLYQPIFDEADRLNL